MTVKPNYQDLSYCMWKPPKSCSNLFGNILESWQNWFWSCWSEEQKNNQLVNSKCPKIFLFWDLNPAEFLYLIMNDVYNDENGPASFLCLPLRDISFERSCAKWRRNSSRWFYSLQCSIPHCLFNQFSSAIVHSNPALIRWICFALFSFHSCIFLCGFIRPAISHIYVFRRQRLCWRVPAFFFFTTSNSEHVSSSYTTLGLNQVTSFFLVYLGR